MTLAVQAMVIKNIEKSNFIKSRFYAISVLALVSIAGMIISACAASQNPETKFTKEIDTGKGTLFLTYSNGKALLSGTLGRSVPCVEYSIDIISTRDFPASNI